MRRGLRSGGIRWGDVLPLFRSSGRGSRGGAKARRVSAFWVEVSCRTCLPYKFILREVRAKARKASALCATVFRRTPLPTPFVLSSDRVAAIAAYRGRVSENRLGSANHASIRALDTSPRYASLKLLGLYSARTGIGVRAAGYDMTESACTRRGVDLGHSISPNHPRTIPPRATPRPPDPFRFRSGRPIPIY